MDPYKRDNFKGMETKTNLGVYYLAHSMSSVVIYWHCIFQYLVRKTEATPYIAGMKDFNIGNVSLNNFWKHREMQGQGSHHWWSQRELLEKILNTEWQMQWTSCPPTSLPAAACRD